MPENTTTILLWDARLCASCFAVYAREGPCPMCRADQALMLESVLGDNGTLAALLVTHERFESLSREPGSGRYSMRFLSAHQRGVEKAGLLVAGPTVGAVMATARRAL